MLLAAGRGTRLAPLTDTVPKPLLDIDGQPLIAHQLGWLKRAGVERVVVNLYHLGGAIRDTVGDGREFGLEVLYSEETQPLETGGGVRLALPLLGPDPFIVLNGDIWTDFDFATLPDRPTSNTLAHLVLTPTPAHRTSGDFGLQHRRANRQGRDHVYCGIGVLTAALLGAEHGAFSLREPMFDAAVAGRLGASRFLGRWTDIGTHDQLAAVRAEVKGA